MPNNDIVPLPSVEAVKESEVPSLLQNIRPAWQAKNLILRVKRLLKVDPSSACQRLFNAAIHDLREKIYIAGLDIASEAAKQNKLPPVNNQEDLENYPTAKLINLAYRLGLLSRPEWRRISRCYEIRRDLEHEDNEYEAGIEDCVYVFKTCIDVVLAKDPVQLLKVTDIKEVVEESKPVAPADSLLSDFKQAPDTRQEKILKFLVSYALNKDHADIVQQNAFTFLQRLAPLTHNQVKLKLATYFQDILGRDPLDKRHARVAYAMGVLPYLREAQRADLFNEIYAQMEKVGWQWRGYTERGELLRSFKEVGGVQYCPAEQKNKILKWLVLTYLGEPGGMTRYGSVRHVFYSNTASSHIEDLIKSSQDLIADDLRALAEDNQIKNRCSNQYIARRFEELLDLVEMNED